MYISVIVIYDTNIHKGGVIVGYIRNTLISFLFLVGALVVTVYYGRNIFSIVMGIVGFLVFSYNFKRFRLIGPLIFLLIFLLPAVFSSGINFAVDNIPFLNRSVFYSGESNNIENPEKTLLPASNIEIQGMGFLVIFDEQSDVIQVPDGVVVKRSGDSLKIETAVFKSGPFGIGKSLNIKKIIIGAKSHIERLSIDGMKLKMEGYINPDVFLIDGMGISIDGTIDVNKIKIDGMGIKIHATIVKAPYIEVNGMGADLDLVYKEPWEGVWYLDVKGLGAKIRYKLPPLNQGRLEIYKNTMGITVKQYGD